MRFSWWTVLIKRINTRCFSSSSAIKSLCIRTFTLLFVLWQKKSRTTTCEFCSSWKRCMQNWKFLIQQCCSSTWKKICKIENIWFNSTVLLISSTWKRINECLSLDFFFLESFVMLVTYQQQRFDQLQETFHHQRSLRQILFWIKRDDVCFFWAWVSRFVK